MLKILVAGAGPAGLYVCRNVLGLSSKIHVDLYEMTSSLYGLLASGVSPDKPAIKSIIPSFDKTLSNPNLSVHLGKKVGDSVSIASIAENYDYFIPCTGASIPRDIAIPGLYSSVFQALDFCNYYNGVVNERSTRISDFLNKNKHVKYATIIGNGNVALDAAKMLSYPKEFLEKLSMNSDVVDNMPEVERVYIIGRSGWGNAKFTNAQLASIVDSDLLFPVVSPDTLRDGSSQSSGRVLERRKKMLEKMAKNYDTQGERVVEFIFDSNVTRIDQDGSVMRVEVSGSKGDKRVIESHILLKALGFERDHVTLDILSEKSIELCKQNNCQVISAGWCRDGARGDLSKTIIHAKECSEIIKRRINQ